MSRAIPRGIASYQPHTSPGRVQRESVLRLSHAPYHLRRPEGRGKILDSTGAGPASGRSLRGGSLRGGAVTETGRTGSSAGRLRLHYASGRAPAGASVGGGAVDPGNVRCAR